MDIKSIEEKATELAKLLEHPYQAIIITTESIKIVLVDESLPINKQPN